MLRLLSASLIALLSCAHGYAQIVIDKEDYNLLFQEGFQRITFGDPEAASYAVGAPGGDNVWDFSGAEAQDTTTEIAVAPQNTPFAGLFPDADYALLVQPDTSVLYDAIYSFFLEEEGDLLRMGGGLNLREPDGEDSTYRLYYLPFLPDLVFPLTLDTSWSFSGFEFNEGIRSPFYRSDSVTVDGFGTLVMPDGSTREALRISTEITYLMIPTWEVFLRFREFLFLAQDGAFVVVRSPSIAGGPLPDSGTIADATLEWSYGPESTTSLFRPPPGITGFTLHRLYPNPTPGPIRVDYALAEGRQLDMRLVDLSGRAVQTLFQGWQATGEHTQVFSAEGLSPGVYVLQVRTVQGTLSRRLVLGR